MTLFNRPKIVQDYLRLNVQQVGKLPESTLDFISCDVEQSEDKEVHIITARYENGDIFKSVIMSHVVKAAKLRIKRLETINTKITTHMHVESLMQFLISLTTKINPVVARKYERSHSNAPREYIKTAYIFAYHLASQLYEFSYDSIQLRKFNRMLEDSRNEKIRLFGNIVSDKVGNSKNNFAHIENDENIHTLCYQHYEKDTWETDVVPILDITLPYMPQHNLMDVTNMSFFDLLGYVVEMSVRDNRNITEEYIRSIFDEITISEETLKILIKTAIVEEKSDDFY